MSRENEAAPVPSREDVERATEALRDYAYDRTNDVQVRHVLDVLSALAASASAVREARAAAFDESAATIERVRASYDDSAEADEALEVARNNVLALAAEARKP